MQHVILGFFRDNANDFELVALGLGALGVTIGQGQGKGILGSIHKGRQLVAVGIGFAAPALAFGAVLAAAGILKLIQKLLAHHNGDHILAVIHAAFGPVAAFQLVAQQGHGVRVQAENAPYITGAVAVVFACFYINTLDSIIWMAEGRKYEEVVLMTASLARLLRQSISNEDEVVPLAREVEYAKGYLTIQKMRYKDKLEFEIDVEPSILNIPLIKLVLQPIIENAIYHGLKYKESKGLLQVKGFMKDGNAVLQVIDNGVGMDEETLSHIYDKHKVNYHSNGVGVYNVQKRLKLYYGENYGITYESEKGVGTTATITIPGIQEESI